MYLIDLAVQGARGFSPSLRLSPLRPGYLVLKPPAGNAAPLCGLLTAILYSDGRGGEASFLAPGQKGKVGLSLMGNDQLTYHLTRELGGAGGLYRLDPKTKQFAPITQDASEMAQFLRSQVGLPTKTAFEQLFTLSASHLPSRKPRPKAGQGTAASGPKPALASQLPVTAASDVAAAQAKLDELKRELALSQEVDQIQFRADGVASELFELENKLKGTEGVKAALRDAEAAHTAAPTVEALGLPVDIVSRIERYPQVTQKREEALARLEADREQAEAAPASVESLTKNQQFWAGIGGGVAFLLAGLFVPGMGRYLSLLDIPAFGFSALLALRHVDDLQRAERSSRKSGMWAAREKKIQDEYEAEAQHIRAAVAKLRVDEPGQIIELLGRKALLLEKVQQYRDQLAAMEADPEHVSASGRLQQLKAQQEKLNAELTEKGSYLRDPREIEREIARTEESILLAQAAPQPAAASPDAGGGSPQDTFEDPSPALLRLASDLLQADVPGVGALLKERCSQYLTALTDKRYLGVELDKDGKATLLAAGSKRVPASETPGKDLDLFYLALRLTLIEKISARAKILVVVEDAPGVVEEAKLTLLSRMLKHLGTLTQLIHATGHPGFAAVADLSANL